jgi:hypothetical protein
MPILVKHNNVWKTVTAGSSVDINMSTDSPLGSPDWDEDYEYTDQMLTAITFTKDDSKLRQEIYYTNQLVTSIEYYVSGDGGVTFTQLGTKDYTYDNDIPVSAEWTPVLHES